MVPYMTPMMAEHWLNTVGLNPGDEFNIENGEMVDKIIQAALLCKSMVAGLEDLEVIPGFIVYDEIKKDKTEEIIKEKGGSKDKNTGESSENKDLQ